MMNTSAPMTAQMMRTAATDQPTMGSAPGQSSAPCSTHATPTAAAMTPRAAKTIHSEG